MSSFVGALLGTSTICVSFAVLASAFVGLGLLVRRACGLKDAELDDLFVAFWMGFGLVIVCLTVSNFWFAIGPPAFAIALAAGFTGLALARRSVHAALLEAQLPKWAWFAAAGLGLWIANLATARMSFWDTALYHMQVVKWARTYPAVPGVANLFGPLGFNNSSLLYVAMLDAGPWKDNAWHVANGVLVWMLGAQAITSGARLLRADGVQAAKYACALPLLAVVVNTALAGKVSSFATALPVTMVVLVVALRGYAVSVDVERPARDKAYDYFCMATLAAVATSIKLSAAVFAAGVVALCCVGIWRLADAPELSRGRALFRTLAATGVVGVAWAARGVILSGYVMFPSRGPAPPVVGRGPADPPRAEFDFVVHSAFGTSDDMDFVAGRTHGTAAWFPHWWASASDDLFAIFIPSALALLSGIVILAARRRAGRPEMPHGWSMLAPAAVAVAAWATVAPMPHYGEPFFWSLAGVMLAQAFRSRPASASLARRVFIAGVLLGLAPCFIRPTALSKSSDSRGVLHTILKNNFRLPNPGDWFQVTKRQTDMVDYTTRSGLVLHVPTGVNGRSWDSPVPCTPNPAPNLRLRVPGHIERGFVVDGEWQMRDWPETWRPDLLPAMREGWSKRAESASTD
jgi:hypothetical protein